MAKHVHSFKPPHYCQKMEHVNLAVHSHATASDTKMASHVELYSFCNHQGKGGGRTDRTFHSSTTKALEDGRKCRTFHSSVS